MSARDSGVSSEPRPRRVRRGNRLDDDASEDAEDRGSEERTSSDDEGSSSEGDSRGTPDMSRGADSTQPRASQAGDREPRRDGTGYALQEVKDVVAAVRKFASTDDAETLDADVKVALHHAELLDGEVYTCMLGILQTFGWAEGTFAQHTALSGLMTALDGGMKGIRSRFASKRVGRPSKRMRAARLAQVQGLPPADTSTAQRKRKRKEAEQKLLQVSVTVIKAGTHLPMPIFNQLDTFMKERCSAGLFAYELGGQEANGHGQGVLRLMGSNVASVTKELKAFLSATTTGVEVLCRGLTGKGLHTWLGLIGYCLKDAGQPHFALHAHNVSNTEMERGKEEHMTKGAGLLKKRVCLNTFNLITQMTNYRSFHMPRANISPARVLTSMLRTGKYYPSASWAVTGAGKGMHLQKLDAIWKSIVEPEMLSIKDIMMVFFNSNPNERYFTPVDPYEFVDDEAWDAGTLDNLTAAGQAEDMQAQRRRALAPGLSVFDQDGFAEPPDREDIRARTDAADEVHNELAYDLHNRRTQTGTTDAFGS